MKQDERRNVELKEEKRKWTRMIHDYKDEDEDENEDENEDE